VTGWLPRRADVPFSYRLSQQAAHAPNLEPAEPANVMIFNFFSLAFHVALVIYCSHVLLNYGRALTAVGFYFTLATLLFQVFAASQGAAELAGAWQETQTTRLALLAGTLMSLAWLATCSHCRIIDVRLLVKKPQQRLFGPGQSQD
jgi:hypothetical protein